MIADSDNLDHDCWAVHPAGLLDSDEPVPHCRCLSSSWRCVTSRAIATEPATGPEGARTTAKLIST
jgi:hypothetical protein